MKCNGLSWLILIVSTCLFAFVQCTQKDSTLQDINDLFDDFSGMESRIADPIYLLEANDMLYHNSQELADSKDSEIYRSYMNIRVAGGRGKNMCVECWSGDHNNDRSGCSTNSSDTKMLSWNFISLAATKFWCTATWGSKFINQFPVFGDGVPKKSSNWLVNNVGKVRTHEDNYQTNDFLGFWES